MEIPKTASKTLRFFNVILNPNQMASECLVGALYFMAKLSRYVEACTLFALPFGSMMVTFYFKVPNTEFNLNVVTS